MSNSFKLLLNRFNHQKNYLDKPADNPSVSDTEDATTEDTESGDEDMRSPEPKVSPSKTSPPKAQYPGNANEHLDELLTVKSSVHILTTNVCAII